MVKSERPCDPAHEFIIFIAKASRENSFSVRIVEDWNSLPEEVVSVKTVLQFKTRLDKMWIHRRFDDSEIY